MNKNRLLHYFKMLITILAFVAIYFISAVITTIISIKPESFNAFWSWFKVLAPIPVIVSSILIILLCCLTNLHVSSYRHASVSEILKIGIISAITFCVNIVIDLLVEGVSTSWCIVTTLLFFVFSSCAIYSYRVFSFLKSKSQRALHYEKRVIIVGAGIAGVTILREIQGSDKICYKVVGFVDDDQAKIGSIISGVKVLGPVKRIKEFASDKKADLIIIAIPSASAQTIKEISKQCIETKCEVKVSPGLYQLIDGELSVSRLRDIDVNDLLGREPVSFDLNEVMGYIQDQVVLVTGGGGSIGSELCRQIASHNPKRLIILDIYENNAYEIEQELKRKYFNLNLVTLIASIRDSGKMDDVFKTYKPDIVFHAAAHKHVPLMETSPNEAVKNNVLGTYKVVKAADKYRVKRFIQISTDKAVNPTNIMGATKRVCEMIIQAFSRKSKTQFAAVRFGNVLGSNGSVIPLFKKQIAEGGPVTVTHKDIIRYFMTIPEAVSLVLQAGAYAKGGEIFVLDMGEQVRIYDLAVNLIKLSGYEPNVDIEIKITGLRPGEKLYEERLMAEEGLTKTANNRISIGKPIELDDDKLFKTLDMLYDEAYAESEKMKDLVKELVPTYKIDRR